MALIEAGKIVNTHGIHGDIKVMSWAKSPEVLLDMETFYVDSKPYDVEKSRIHKGAVLIKLVGVSTLEEAEALKNKIIYADEDDFELEENEFFIRDLIGITVSDVDTGEVYGKIVNVIETGANDVYEVKNEAGRTYLIPAIKDCIILTDIEEKIMKIRPLEGLFDI